MVHTYQADVKSVEGIQIEQMLIVFEILVEAVITVVIDIFIFCLDCVSS